MIDPGQAQEIAAHYHHWIWVMFTVGYLCHVLAQVDAAARAPNNPINSRVKIFQNNSIRIVGRFFISLCLFMEFFHNPAAIASLIGTFGVTVSPNMTAILTLPINPAVAGMWGFFIDSALAYVPVLKNAVPPPVSTNGVTVTAAVTVSKTP